VVGIFHLGGRIGAGVFWRADCGAESFVAFLPLALIFFQRAYDG